MTSYYVVPDQSGYGSWAIKKNGMKVQDAQTQATGKNSARSLANEGDQVYVYGSRSDQIVNSFTVQ